MDHHPSPESLFRGIPRLLVTAVALALSACGGAAGGGGGDGSAGGGVDGGGAISSGTGSLTIAVTDKPPMPEIIEVNVVFTGITLKPQEGETISFECADAGFDCSSDADGSDYTRTIDLRALIGDTREVVLDAAVVPAGLYEWIRLHVDAATPAHGSSGASNVVFATDPDGSAPLVIPSGQQTGLKLVSGFEVPDGGAASFTIDFDLRSGLVWTGNGNGNGRGKGKSNGRVMLKPAHRLVDNGGVGVLRGEVSPDFEVAPGLKVSDSNCRGPAAYAYSAEEFTGAGQVGSVDGPVATAELKPVPMGGSTSNSTYEIGFLEAGDYRVAIACAEQDGEEADDDDDLVPGPGIPISATQPAPIVAGEATQRDFLPPPP